MQRSDTFTARVTADAPLSGVTVSGPCLTGDTPLTVSSDGRSAEGTPTVRASAPVAACELTVTSSFADGSTDVDRVTVDVVAEDAFAVSRPTAGQSVQRSDTATAEVTGSGLQTVRVSSSSGCVVPTTLVTAADGGSAEGVVRIADTATVGTCTLLFDAVFRDGEAQRSTVDVTVVEEDAVRITAPAPGAPVQQSDRATAGVAGTGLRSVQVSGACLTASTPLAVSPDRTAATGTVTIAATATVGTCTLTYDTTFTDGETASDTRTVEVRPEDDAVVTTPVAGQQVNRSDTASATIESATGNLQSVTATGPCLSEPVTVTPSDSRTATLVLRIADTATVGACQLSFDSRFTDGETDTDTVAVEVVPDDGFVITAPDTRTVVQRSDTSTATVTGSELASVRVSGDCVAPTTLITSADGTSASGTFRIADTATVGTCTVVFDGTFTDGDVQRSTVDITVAEEDVVRITAPAPAAPVRQSDTATVSVAGTGLSSVRVSGACLTGPVPLDVAPDRTSATGTATIAATATVGTCTLTYDTVFTDGERSTDTRTVDVRPDAVVQQPTPGQQVERGDTFTATVTAATDGLQSVRVDGACLTGPTTLVTGAGGSSASGTPDTADTATVGLCQLLFTSSFNGGRSDTDTRTVEIVDTRPPLFVDGSGRSQAGSTTLTVTYTEDLDCTSVDADGRDFVLSVIAGPDQSIVRSDRFNASCSGRTVTFTLDPETAPGGIFQEGQTVRVSLETGAVVRDTAGNSQPQDDFTDVVVGNAVVVTPVPGQVVVSPPVVGGMFEATVQSPNRDLASVSVTGACLDPETQDVPRDGTRTRTFSGSVDTAGATGDSDCVLTFVAVFDDGTTDTDTVTIRIDGGVPALPGPLGQLGAGGPTA